MTKEFINDPIDLFDRLDAKLEQMNIVLDLVICGGLVLQQVYKSIRATHDIDSLTSLDEFIKEAILEVGQEVFADSSSASGWLNDDAVSFFDFDSRLPAGWEERAISNLSIYRGEYLTVYPLDRRDLILTKLFAVFSRATWDIEKDIKDLKTIGASTDELLEVLEDLVSMLNGSRWEKPREQIRNVLLNFFHT